MLKIEILKCFGTIAELSSQVKQNMSIEDRIYPDLAFYDFDLVF